MGVNSGHLTPRKQCLFKTTENTILEKYLGLREGQLAAGNNQCTKLGTTTYFTLNSRRKIGVVRIMLV
jgi:hypothetical protein